MKKEPVYVGVDDNKEIATVEGLEQVCISTGNEEGTSLCWCG